MWSGYAVSAASAASSTAAATSSPSIRPGSTSSCSTNLDGLIIAGEPDVELLRGWEGPTVVAGCRTALPDGADLVANDDELGGRMAADHLLGLGHRTIGHLTGTSEPAAHRREGFTSRLAEAGLTPRGWATPDNQIARLRQSVARTVRDLHSPRAARPKHLTTEAMSPFHGAFEARRDPAQSRQARRTRNAALPGAVTGIISNEDRKKSDTMVPSFASSAKARFVTSPPGSATMPGNQPPHRPNLAVGRTDHPSLGTRSARRVHQNPSHPLSQRLESPTPARWNRLRPDTTVEPPANPEAETTARRAISTPLDHPRDQRARPRSAQG